MYFIPGLKALGSLSCLSGPLIRLSGASLASQGGLFPVILSVRSLPGWVIPCYSPCLCLPGVVIPCFISPFMPPRVGYSLFYTEERASQGGLFPVLYPDREVYPGWWDTLPTMPPGYLGCIYGVYIPCRTCPVRYLLDMRSPTARRCEVCAEC